ncbi:MAG TPA: sulfatase-like hydrolase/transferase [Polyangiaceae bacterium]|nr:sulfatase-like hydrolase/transferase [Polyangiaceae bacterium]
MKSRSAAFALALLLAGSACRKSAPSPTRSDHGAATPAAVAAAATHIAAPPERIDLLKELPRCEIEHLGRLFDFGGTQPPLRGFAAPQAEPPPSIDRGGDTFERLFSRETLIDFWLDEPAPALAVTVRLHPLLAKWIYVAIDEKRLGSQKLVAGETRALSFPALSGNYARGRHRLSLRLSGAPRASKEPIADLDWVRVGPTLESGSNYAAPTLRDVVSDVVLDNVPKRSIVLRAPSTVRCFVRPSPDAKLRVGLGFWGSGRGTAEVALVSDEKPPRVLTTRKISGGDGGSFLPVSLDLAPAAGELVGLELRAVEGSKGGRVVFGDPMISRATAEIPQPPPARTVVLVVLSAVDRGRVPPWGPTAAMPALADLAKHAVVFSAHRAPSGVPAASFASLISGVSPAVHGIERPLDKLRPKLATVATTLKEAGGRTALFTGVPTTFAPFGFGAGFDVFEVSSPVADLPATEPLARAQAFLEQELASGANAERLVVVALRGGHPPWDLTREETAALKPQEYSGILDPRRGAIVLGALREKSKKAARKIGDDDWIRLRALHDAALTKQDAALAKLIASLKSKGAWNDTLLVVTSDVGLGAGPEIPFDPAAPLTEDRLLLPLLVHFPGDALAGKEVTLPTTAADVAATIQKALGLEPLPGIYGDLFVRGSGVGSLTGDVDVSAEGTDYSARLGGWLMRGSAGKTPRLCASDIDPACINDLIDQRPAAARALWLAAFDAATKDARSAAQLGPRQRAELDPDTLAALTVWGDLR